MNLAKVTIVKTFDKKYVVINYAVVCWLGHCTTNLKVAGSIPDCVIAINNPSGRTKAQRLTQPLIEMSTRNIYGGGKGGRCVGLTTLAPSYAKCLEISEPQPPGALGDHPGRLEMF